jgi:DNA-binding CsgD family transcriptional regulator
VAERLLYGIFLVDRRNAVLFANAAATRLGRPTIQRVLAIAERGDGVVTTADARPLVVRVVPLRGPRELLGVPGGQSRLPTATTLRDIYAITPAEARVVLALARGATLREIADELGTSIATVRTQVKSSLEKTGTRRQAELVALVHSLAPPL